MTLLELRSLIETLLSDLVGQYIFRSGQTTPAIAVEDAKDYPYEGTTVTGLEVVIQPNTRDDYAILMGGDHGSAQQTLITLKQWDLEETTEAAIERLKQLPNLTEIRPRVTRNKVMDNIETCVLVCTDYS